MRSTTRFVNWATLGLVLALAACGGGSGRQGTDVVVAGSGPAASVPSGGSAVFKMTVANTGPNPAESVAIVNLVGNQLALLSITCSGDGGATCPEEPTVSMVVPMLPAGGSLTFDVTTQLSGAASGTVSNTMSANFGADTDRANNSATVSAEALSTVSNLVVSGSGPGGTVTGGGTVDFLMTVRNDGPDTATALQFVNNAGSFLVVKPGGVTCVFKGEGGGCPKVLGVTMELDSLPAGASLEFLVSATVTQGVTGTVTNALQVTAATDLDRTDNVFTATASVAAIGADLAVSQSGAAQVNAGSVAVFTAVVSNPTTASASGLTLNSAVTATDQDVVLDGLTIVCTPSSGATCPGQLGPTMTVPSLPAGRSLTFALTLPVAASARGSITSVFAVSLAGDPTNNEARTTAAVIDPRNGSYKAFGADGRGYDMTIDFDAGTYSLVGGAQTAQRTFTADASGGGYTVGGNARLRAANDLVVGAHDFGAGFGVLPFIAARSFGSTLNEVVGQYNLVTRDVPTSGPPATHAAVVAINGNQMFVCQVDTGFIKAPGSSCTADGKQSNYLLTVANGAYLATGAGSTTGSFTFYLARSDASKMLVAANPVNSTGNQLRIALQDAPNLVGGTLSGPSTSGNWLAPFSLTAASYAVTGGTDTATATLISGGQSGQPPTGVGALLKGSRSTDAQPIWVMQSSPLAIAFSDFTATTAAGLLQIALP